MKPDKTYLFLSFIIFLTVFSWFSSCTHETVLDDIPEICFEKDVLPVFRNSCGISGCHDGNGESDLILTSYVPISHAVEPGKPYSSEIYKAIISKTGEDKMPPDRPLPLESRTLIRLWIEQGAMLTSCQDQTGPLNGEGTDYVNPLACFSRDVLPVLISRCASTGCHDAITHEEGFVFSGYNSTMTAVRPGEPLESKLYKVITETSGDDKMPPEGKPQLTAAEIDSIRAWISYGALNQYCGETCDTINPVTFSGLIWPVVQQSCSGCHSGTAPSGGVLISSYNNIATLASSGRLIRSLKGEGITRMPPGNSFSDCRIRQFELWVNNGFLNN